MTNYPIITPFKRLTRSMAIALGERMERNPAPYTFYCIAGDHSWTCHFGNLPSVTMDGSNLNCPHHDINSEWHQLSDDIE